MNNLSIRLLAAVGLSTLVLGIAIGVGWQHLHKFTSTAPPQNNAIEEAKQEPKVLYWYDPMVPDQHFDKPGPSPFMDMELVPKYAEPVQAAEPFNKAEPKILYWYDPMVPDQHFDKPGPSPFMDMELVPKYAEVDVDAPALTVDAGLVQSLGMRKAKVQRLPIANELEVVGQLQFNERNQVILQLRAAGFVEKAWPLAVGDQVSAGQPIAEFQIPEWLDAQNELLSQPVRQSPRLLATLRARLQLLGMPDALIAKVEKTRQPETRVTITSPISGVVDMLDVKTGMALASGDTVAMVNNLDNLWLDAAIPEAQTTGLQPGAKAVFHSASPGDPVLTGTLEYLLPSINASSRTLTARILLDNPEGRLKPGTSGRVLLKSSTEEKGVFVPTEAVIRTGKRVLVMLAEPDGTFMPMNVVTGHEQGSHTRILQGLDEGQEVVASGQFLLDSEASFLGIAPKTAEGHDHD
ncbi:efflux RND transporter periplasmic adaptor subunit [Cellvibrio sp. QJXJ]|uniref:efflux RND transporter periplasmic adaptor subunit n=1 Tax=Cellvibrio sp. QJXJ TaxID=2964606 RepID=UPI0021C3B26D|nr:efflux RND transporter periplasmic adaptor subunit [Cellvibrio sp. QJXJ]UUA74961.1 efflux RND transporter periplasmic adaptor subunit [Cellvibrio sp. QJXJ]